LPTAKANPGKVNHGLWSGGRDLIGGHVSMMVLSLSTILGNVKTGARANHFDMSVQAEPFQTTQPWILPPPRTGSPMFAALASTM
jgi:hypothetical protein